jgi:hypothetical protein
MKGYVSETLNGTARIDPRYDFLTPVLGGWKVLPYLYPEVSAIFTLGLEREL